MVNGFFGADLSTDFALAGLEVDTGFFIDERNHGNGLTYGDSDSRLWPQRHLGVDDLSSVQVFKCDGPCGTEKGTGRTPDTSFRLFVKRRSDSSFLASFHKTDGFSPDDLLTGADTETTEDALLIRVLDFKPRPFNPQIFGDFLDGLRCRSLGQEHFDVHPAR